jgi:hypothetical protein
MCAAILNKLELEAGMIFGVVCFYEVRRYCTVFQPTSYGNVIITHQQ